MFYHNFLKSTKRYEFFDIFVTNIRNKCKNERIALVQKKNISSVYLLDNFFQFFF